MRFHICDFGGYDLPKSKHRSEEAVLAAICKGDGRTNVFEMTQPLWDTLKNLEQKCLIREIKHGYPRIQFEPTQEGQR